MDLNMQQRDCGASRLARELAESNAAIVANHEAFVEVGSGEAARPTRSQQLGGRA